MFLLLNRDPPTIDFTEIDSYGKEGVLRTYPWKIWALSRSILEDLSPIPMLKTTCRNGGKRKNLASAEGLPTEV
ncbi:hypothetical protein TNCV_4543671 [Trichonephila clavipes]|nr:hypothetical protein TNCV_4543671 [Trichonephila clavipes]